MPLNLTRSLLVVLIPGAIALFPWLALLIKVKPALVEFYSQYSQLAWGGLFVAVTVFGSLIEGANSYIEDSWDNEREVKYEVRKNWYDYLARICPSQPVAHSYIARMATTMYFEMAMGWASLSLAACGTLYIVLTAAVPVPTPLEFLKVAASFSAGVAVVSMFFSRGKDSHEALCNTRREVNRRLRYLDAPLPERRRYGLNRV